MAKKQSSSETDNSKIKSLFQSTKADYGAITGVELEESEVGIAIPTYSERYYRDSNVYQTGKAEMYVGGFGSGKSSYGFHVGCAFLDVGGIFVMIETEHKVSALTMRANLGRERFGSDRVWFIQAGHPAPKEDSEKDELVVSWQRALSGVVKKIVDAGLSHVPVYILVDSILGEAGTESREEYEEDGQMRGRSTSDMARAASITKFLQNFTADLGGTKILVGFTNHAKETIAMGQNAQRGPQLSIPGGKSLGFHCSLVLRFERGKAVSSTTVSGRNVWGSVIKNSFGDEDRKIELGFRYDHLRDDKSELIMDDNNNPIRVVKWDWYEASTWLLHDFCLADGKYPSAEARRLLPMTYKGGKYGSPDIDGGAEYSAGEFGQKLEANPDVLARVMRYCQLSIGHRRVYQYKPA